MIAKSLGYLVWPSVGTSVGSLELEVSMKMPTLVVQVCSDLVGSFKPEAVYG